jgi:DNA-binding CsgD family transcriptional regulator
MQHFTLFIFFFTLTAGAAGFPLLLITYVKVKQDYLFYYLLFYSALIAELFAAVIIRYFELNAFEIYFSLRMVFGFSRRLVHYSVMASLIVFIHNFFKVSYKKQGNTAAVIMGIILLFADTFTPQSMVINKEIITTSYFPVHDFIFYGSIIYCIITGILYYGKNENEKGKVLVKYLIITGIIFLPFLILDELGIFFFGINYNPYCYIALSLITINYCIKYHLFEFYIVRKEAGELNTELTDVYLEKHGISRREKDIILEILKGHSNKKIGEILFISVSTVKKHIYSIFKKLNISNRYQLMCSLLENIKFVK